MDVLNPRDRRHAVVAFEGMHDCFALQLLLCSGRSRKELRAFRRELNSKDVMAGRAVACLSVTVEQLEEAKTTLLDRLTHLRTKPLGSQTPEQIRGSIELSTEMLHTVAKIDSFVHPAEQVAVCAPTNLMVEVPNFVELN